MTTLQKLNIKDAVWLFNNENGERLLAERRPAELVAEGYMDCLYHLLDTTGFREPDEEEEPIQEGLNPYEVVELCDEDVRWRSIPAKKNSTMLALRRRTNCQ